MSFNKFFSPPGRSLTKVKGAIMSQAAKQSIIFLIVLLIAAFAFAGFMVMEKEKIGKEKIGLEKQIGEFQTREKKYILDNKDLQDKLKTIETAKADLEKRMAGAGGNLEEIDAKIANLTKERDDWKKRVDTLTEERDKVVAKLQENGNAQAPAVAGADAQAQTNEIAELKKSLSAKEEELQKALASVEEMKAKEKVAAAMPAVDDDSYWAQVLKQKATLEVELDDVKNQLSKSSVELVDFKKQNSDLQLEISKLKNDQEEISRKIKYGNDLSDTLSLELARAQNDRKFVSERADKINDENDQLHGQIKELTSTKIALEKSIVHLQGEKKDIEKRLMQTEGVIQNRIDEIWKIKDSLDDHMKSSREQSTGVELAPIVVNSQRDKDSETDTVAMPSSSMVESAKEDVAEMAKHGFNGNILSVNEENNFVIVDIGENSGIKLGDALNVYRGVDYVAGLEVIQVRKDIAAADIKNKMAKIEVGDSVK